MKITLRDVAERLGISVSTVSMAMRDNPLVAEETRRRVRAALDEMGYVYNRAGAQLRTRQSLSIGVAINDLMNPFFAEVIAAVEDRLAAAGRMVFLANTSESPERQQMFLRALAEHNADGLIVCPVAGSSVEDFRRFAASRPVVLVSRTLAGLTCDHIVNDDEMGGMLAARHLLDLGHRRIAWIGGGTRTSTFQRRWAGFTATLERAGVAPPVRIAARATREAGAAAASSLVEIDPPPTAAVCFGDLLALGLLAGLRRSGGPRVPEDLSVIGFDGIGEGEMADPVLTTVSIDRETIGKTAAAFLLERLADKGRPIQSSVVVPTLRPGATTGPCR
ncbi:LacI family DNA-binding transcriptional regulator [Fodinicurvata sp. EGI_FJ10296]|uniref:LacI family DNA-binding transcriptional regulator n=1 Tax=Fodinicurvata sp. EGI_FJ10296 TaxID=3231908 RepID=UPI00345507F2